MAPSRAMAAVDAEMFWMSAHHAGDLLVLYAFAGSPTDPGAAVEQMRRRAQTCDELRMRVVDAGWWRYPRWQRGEVGADQFVIRPEGEVTWQDCLDVAAGLRGDQLDLHRMTWRAQIFPRVVGIAGGPRVGSVVLMQLGHAFADGSRGTALAGALLGRPAPVAVPAWAGRGSLLVRGVSAALGYRRLVRDTEAGVVPPPARACPPLSINARPGPVSVVRTLVMSRDDLARPTVTIGALAAISEALAGYLAARGEDISALGAEVTMAGQQNTFAHNNFRNVGIKLHPELDRAARTAAIAAELADQRRRGEHPAMRAWAAAFAATPAALLRWGVGQFDPSARSATVTGNTVVSSVNRGPADLCFGGFPVLFAAGFSAVSPMMSLTHGVHGLGGTVTLGVHADPGNVDVEDYVDRLRTALGR